MKVGELSEVELGLRLREGALSLRVGKFAVGIESRLPSIQKAIGQLYADFSLEGDDQFLDYRVKVSSPLSRRWVRPQAVFTFEGRAPFKPLPAAQAFPMLEWGLNWVISNHAHQYLIIHAAALERAGHGLILAAPPGSGKSTLCAALAASGWRLLSDELALVDLIDGQLVPIARPISLKNRSIDIVGELGTHVVIGDACSDTAKGTVAHMKPPGDSVLRSSVAAQPAWIIFPKYSPDGPLTVSYPGKGEAFIELVRNAFNYPILARDGFRAMTRLVEACEVAHMTYRSLDDVTAAIEEIWDAIEEPGGH